MRSFPNPLHYIVTSSCSLPSRPCVAHASPTPPLISLAGKPHSIQRQPRPLPRAQAHDERLRTAARHPHGPDLSSSRTQDLPQGAGCHVSRVSITVWLRGCVDLVLSLLRGEMSRKCTRRNRSCVGYCCRAVLSWSPAVPVLSWRVISCPVKSLSCSVVACPVLSSLVRLDWPPQVLS